MADWDKTSPADDSIVSSFPANERAARGAVETIFDIDHHSADDADQGKHDKVQLTDLAGDATIAAGQVGIWNNGGNLNTRVATGAVARIVRLVSGTKALWPQASAPTGWTQDTDANDRVIRVVDNTGTGGATGGNWTLSGMSVDGHTLTIAQMPSHNHTVTHNAISNGGTVFVGSGGGGGAAASIVVNNQGGGGSHNHGLTNTSWRPAYLDVIKATLD